MMRLLGGQHIQLNHMHDESRVCENDNYSTTNLVTLQDKEIPLTEEILVKGIYIVLEV